MLPHHIRRIIQSIATANPTWGVRRVANEIRLRLGIDVSHEMYAESPAPALQAGHRSSSQSEATFIRNNANALIAWTLLTVITARLQIAHVFVAIEIG